MSCGPSFMAQNESNCDIVYSVWGSFGHITDKVDYVRRIKGSSASFSLYSINTCNSTKQIIGLQVIFAGLSPHCVAGGNWIVCL